MGRVFAHDWDELLLPEIERQQAAGIQVATVAVPREAGADVGGLR